MPSTTQCYFCTASSYTVVHKEHGYEARKCLECGTLYPYPFPNLENIDATCDLHEKEWYTLSSPYKLEWLKRRRQAPQSLLEIGCGEGDFLKLAQSANYSVCGIEPHHRRAKQCQDEGLDVKPCFLSEYSKQSRKKFDIIYHVDLLAHFLDPLNALKEMASMLNPNGVLFFEVGALGGLHPWWYTQVGQLGLPYHLWLYSIQSLKILFQRANLRICAHSSFGLSGTVALGKGVRLLRKVQKKNVVPVQQRSHTPKHHLKLSVHMFTRYKIGALLPKVGPTTHFFLLKSI